LKIKLICQSDQTKYLRKFKVLIISLRQVIFKHKTIHLIQGNAVRWELVLVD